MGCRTSPEWHVLVQAGSGGVQGDEADGVVEVNGCAAYGPDNCMGSASKRDQSV